MAIQTSYSQNMGTAIAGLVVDPLNGKIDSRALESAAGVDAGVVVTKGAGPNKCKLIANSADLLTIVGIVCNRSMKEPVAGNTAIRFSQKDMLAIIRRGDVWVKVGTTIGDDVSQVYVIHGDAGGKLGQIAPAAGSGNNAATYVPGLYCRVGAAAGGLALVSIAVDPGHIDLDVS